MLNIMVGPPGAGKSFEAVNYHAIPALKGGCIDPKTKKRVPRQVVTNLPINRDVVASVLGDDVADLLVVLGDRPGKRFGASLADYSSTWRGPDNKGPLYIIDEAHKALPQKGVSPAVLEWYAEHRHHGADVLLITQAYGKIHKQLVDMCQVLYRTRKALGLGTSKGYIRKVQDGPRGAVLSQELRRYTRKGYAWYTSHTHSNAAVLEGGASDFKSIFLRWPFLALAVVVPLALYMVATKWDRLNILQSHRPAPAVSQSSPARVMSSPVPVHRAPAPAPVASVASPQVAPPAPPASPSHPFAGRQLHSLGEITYDGRQQALIRVSQNGQPGVVLSADEMAPAGYRITVAAHCMARVEFEGQFVTWAVCDLGTVGLPSPSSDPPPS